jgi:alkylation response protein AidB-like acyl-CoA dehydrogenase
MGHFKSNLRDIEFNLFEVLNRQEVLGAEPFADVDEETARGILDEVRRLAEGPIAESFADADRHPPVFDPATHSVTMPESFKRSYNAFIDAEWFRLELPTELGGTNVPRTLAWSVAELILGANPAVWMYSSLGSFSHALWLMGTPAQKKIAEQAVAGRWGYTMVLTEPDAGSDVGAGRTKAIQQPDGTWHIEGVKRLVPKFQVNDDGSLGKRNGVYATNVEHKMGLKASTTCELTFGAEHPAVGTLIGDVHDGIRQMFMIIEFARMMVGTKAIAALSTGYLNALDYAKTRVQGADMTQMTDKAAPRVTIMKHPDVRRSLLQQKAYAEGMRALVLYTASQQDAVQLAAASGKRDDRAVALNDLLLPIVKGVGSERGYEQLAQSLQTLGGSGYLQDYPIEQYIRDSKIDSLYEGTTAIQGMDLYFRKIVRNQAAALTYLLEQVRAFAGADNGNGRLKKERAALARAADNVEGIVTAMNGFLGGSLEQAPQIYRVGLNTTRLLLALGDLVVGWLLGRQAEVALARLDDGNLSANDVAFYQGKVAVAGFFTATVLPRLGAEREIAEATTLDPMELPEEAF